jgi:hypothetical protein
LAHALAIVLFAKGSNRDVSDGRLEFDERMGTVVTKGWNSFAIGTEVGIVTDGTLVACTSNVLLMGFTGAERAITVDAKVDLLESAEVGDLFVKGCKPMPGVNLRCAENASRAVIPIGAAQTLVTDAKDVLWY